MAIPGMATIGLSLVLRGATSFILQISRSDKATAQMNDTLGKTVTASQRAERAWGILGITAATFGSALLGLTYSMSQQAIESERYSIATDNIARAMGLATEQVQNEREELNLLYVPTKRANEMIGQLAMAQVNFRQASDLARVGLDLSTLSNKGADKAVRDVTDAVTNLTVSKLAEYGIVTTTTRIYDWYANSLGKVTKQLTTFDRRQAIVNYLLTVGTGIAGAFESTLNTASGQMEVFNFWIAEIRDSFGRTLLPNITSSLKAINNLLSGLEAMPDSAKGAITGFMSLAGAILGVGGTLTLVGPGLKLLFTALKTLIIMVNPAKIALVLLAATFGYVVSSNDQLRSSFTKIASEIFNSIKSAVQDSIPWLRAIGSIMGDAFASAGRTIARVVGDISGKNFGFKFDAEKFFVGASTMMANFAYGLLKGFNDYVMPAVIAIISGIADFFGSSMPKKGPLKNIELGGLAVIQAFIRGMSDASKEQVEKIAKDLKQKLTVVIWDIEDAFFQIENRVYKLDSALWSLQDSLFMIRAGEEFVLIPLQRQERLLTRTQKIVERRAKEEREAAERYLRILEKQKEQIDEIVKIDEERLEVVNHEIFMEENRNRILKRASSMRLLALRSQGMEAENQLDVDKDRQEILGEQIKDEKDRLELLITASEAQLKAIERLLEANQEEQDLAQERITYAEEELRLAEARQAADRLRITQDERYWREVQREASYYLSIINRLNGFLETTKESVAAVIDEYDRFPKFPPIPPVDTKPLEDSLSKLKEKLLAPWGILGEQMDRLNLLMWNVRQNLDNIFGIKYDYTGMTGGPEGAIFEKQASAFDTKFKNPIEAGIKGIIKWFEAVPASIALSKQAYNEFFIGAPTGITGGPEGMIYEPPVLSKAWDTFATSIKTKWDGIIESIKEYINEKAKSFVNPFEQYLVMSPEEQGRAVAKAVKSILSFFSDLYIKVTEEGAKIFLGIGKWLGENIYKYFAFWAQPEKPAVPEKEVADFIFPADKIKSAIGEAIFQAFSNIQTNILNGIKFMWGLIDELTGNQISGTVAKIVLWITSRVTDIITGLIFWRNAFLDWLGDVVKDIDSRANKFLLAVISFITRKLPDIIIALAKWIVAFLDWPADVIKDIDSRLDKFLKASTDWITEKVDDIIKTLLLWINAFLDWVDDIVKDIGKRLDVFRDKVTAWITTAVETLKTSLGQWKDAFLNWIDGAKENIALKLDEFLTAVKTWFDTTGIPGIIAKAGEFAQKIVEAVKDWFKDKTNLPYFIDLGSGFIDGIKKGIDDGWTSFKTWLSSKASGIINAILDGFGIRHSPPAIMIDMGKDLISGLKIGWGEGMDDWKRELISQIDFFVVMGRRIAGGFTSGWENVIDVWKQSVRNEVLDFANQISQVVSARSEAYGPTPASVINYNYSRAPVMNLTAHYGKTQSMASIKDDISLMLAIA